jgi:hypothetical protein
MHLVRVNIHLGGLTYTWVELTHTWVGLTHTWVGLTCTLVGLTCTWLGLTYTWVELTYTWVGLTHTRASSARRAPASSRSARPRGAPCSRWSASISCTAVTLQLRRPLRKKKRAPPRKKPPSNDLPMRPADATAVAYHTGLRPAPPDAVQRCKKLQIVCKGFRVGDRSRGRYATPAGFPRQDSSPYSHARVSRASLGFVRRSSTGFCRPVPNPNISIRNFVHRCITQRTH